MTKQVSNTVTVERPVMVEYTEEVDGELDGSGNPTTVTVTRMRTEMQGVEETVTNTVPDMSGAEATNIFAFGYAKLKVKLQELFGEANVVDC
jgi:hypothetical protein